MAEENEEYGSFIFLFFQWGKKKKHEILHFKSDNLFCPIDSVCVDNVALFWVSKHISLWGSISFNLAVLVNIAVALFYPFGDDEDEGKGIRYYIYYYFSCTESL